MDHKIIIESLKLEEDTVIWKYLDISKFISLISKKSLWLARADTFKDQYEGKFPLEMKETLDKIYKDFATQQLWTESP